MISLLFLFEIPQDILNKGGIKLKGKDKNFIYDYDQYKQYVGWMANKSSKIRPFMIEVINNYGLSGENSVDEKSLEVYYENYKIYTENKTIFNDLFKDKSPSEKFNDCLVHWTHIENLLNLLKYDSKKIKPIIEDLSKAKPKTTIKDIAEIFELPLEWYFYMTEAAIKVMSTDTFTTGELIPHLFIDENFFKLFEKLNETFKDDILLLNEAIEAINSAFITVKSIFKGYNMVVGNLFKLLTTPIGHILPQNKDEVKSFIDNYIKFYEKARDDTTIPDEYRNKISEESALGIIYKTLKNVTNDSILVDDYAQEFFKDFIRYSDPQTPFLFHLKHRSQQHLTAIDNYSYKFSRGNLPIFSGEDLTKIKEYRSKKIDAIKDYLDINNILHDYFSLPAPSEKFNEYINQPDFLNKFDQETFTKTMKAFREIFENHRDIFMTFGSLAEEMFKKLERLNVDKATFEDLIKCFIFGDEILSYYNASYQYQKNEKDITKVDEFVLLGINVKSSLEAIQKIENPTIDAVLDAIKPANKEGQNLVDNVKKAINSLTNETTADDIIKTINNDKFTKLYSIYKEFGSYYYSSIAQIFNYSTKSDLSNTLIGFQNIAREGATGKISFQAIANMSVQVRQLNKELKKQTENGLSPAAIAGIVIGCIIFIGIIATVCVYFFVIKPKSDGGREEENKDEEQV